MRYAQETLGFTPFDVIELTVPEAGLTGVAFVLPTPVNPAARAGHRVYLKRMLLAESAEGLLPDWAFFARCVVDSHRAAPDREPRGALRGQPARRRPARRSATSCAAGWSGWPRPTRAGWPSSSQVHHLGVKALALHDDEMLRLVEQWWPMETNVGPMTLAEFRARHGADPVRGDHSTSSASSPPSPPRRTSALVNGGYTYDAELIERLPPLDRRDPRRAARADRPDHPLRRASTRRPSWRCGRSCPPRSGRSTGSAARWCCARSTRRRCRRSTWSAGRRVPRPSCAATREQADELWGGVLDALAATAPPDRPQLVLNHRNPLVRRVTALADPELARLAVEALYGQALLLGHHPIRPADAALLNSSFLGLLDRAVPDRRTCDRRAVALLHEADIDAVRRRRRSPPSSRCSGTSTPPATGELAFAARMLGHHRRTSTAASRRSRS